MHELKCVLRDILSGALPLSALPGYLAWLADFTPKFTKES